jgi:hypothetical protein
MGVAARRAQVPHPRPLPGDTGGVNPLVIAAVVGPLTLWVGFRVMKFAMKLAFLVALVFGGAATYLVYAAS